MYKLPRIDIELKCLDKGYINDMCRIEEQATIYFKSKNRIITILKIKHLKIEIDKIIFIVMVARIKNIIENLNNPKDPNLSISLARSIEHAPEALTCALVNQKWKNIKGNFVKKITKKVSHTKILLIWFPFKKFIVNESNIYNFNIFEENIINKIEPTMFIENIINMEDNLSESLEKFKIKKAIKYTVLSKIAK